MTYITTIEAVSEQELVNFDQFVKAGQQLRSMQNNLGFMIGDWVLYGREHFPEQMELALEQSEIEPRTAKKCAVIAKQFPKAVRSQKLAFDHHQAVASLSKPDALQILHQAERKDWKLSEVKEAVTKHRYETGQIFDDEDVDYYLMEQIVRCWNRATVEARQSFWALAENANFQTIDEDDVEKYA